MRVTVLELPAAWNDAARVLALAEERIARAPTDLVLLPEQCLTGYVSPRGDFDLTRFAEPLDGPTATSLAALARRRAIHLVAPLVLAEPGGIYNATVCFGPEGARRFVYRKRHPWFPERWATPGTEPPPLVEIGGLAVTICVCYDIHFVADELPGLLGEADLLLFPSAWVDEQDSRIPTLRALARRFDVVIANANWAPGVVEIPGQGGSIILDVYGGADATAIDGRADLVLQPRRR